MGKYLVGIDEGTTGCKTCVFDLEGNLLGMSYSEYPCIYPKPGYVEQKVEEVLPKLFATCKEAIEQSGIDPNEIEAMGLSTISNTFCFLDKDENILHDFVIWNDIRVTEKQIDQLKNTFTADEHYHKAGRPITTGNASVAKLLWFKDNEPEVLEKADRLCCTQDYYLKQFGADGYYVDDTSASRMAVSSIYTHEWSKEHLALAGLENIKLPEIIAEPGKVVGTIKEDISQKTGLPVGCKICLGAIDQNCSTFGGGLVESGSAVMVIGTFGSCFIASEKPAFDPNMKLVVKENHGMGNYTVEGMASAAGSAFRWYRDVCCRQEKTDAEATGKDAYDLIVDGAKNSPIGANGVFFLPYLQGVSAKQDYNARGTFLGMTLGSSHEDMSRAVLEGICYEMRDVADAERAAGIPLSSIRIVGGAAKNDYWCQMFADVMQVPIEVVNAKETGCLGAAMYAGIACGIYESGADAVKRAVSVIKTFEPDAEKSAEYESIFKVWKKAYLALKDSFY